MAALCRRTDATNSYRPPVNTRARLASPSGDNGTGALGASCVVRLLAE